VSGGVEERERRTRDEMEQISDELYLLSCPRTGPTAFHSCSWVCSIVRHSYRTNLSDRGRQRRALSSRVVLSSRSVEYYTRNKVLGPFLGAMPVERYLKWSVTYFCEICVERATEQPHSCSKTRGTWRLVSSCSRVDSAPIQCRTTASRLSRT
jgi:hypothetical protein